jgi:hypothetical protein
MTVDQAKRVCVPFGKYHGWPLESIVRRHVGYLLVLAGMTRLYGELKEAVDTLVAEPSVADQLRRIQTARATEAVNRARLNAWAFR